MSVRATVNYHVKSPEPQAFEFDVDGIIGNLISPELVPTDISVRDLRADPSSVTFARDGITFLKHHSRVSDFDQAGKWKHTYEAEIAALLRSELGAADVTVFDHTVRIDDQCAERKPARNVHNDYSKKGAEQRLVDLLGEAQAGEYAQGHYGFVNIWRPVKHTIKTSPLGFVRPVSMGAGDWMNIELIYPDRVGQILGVAANEAHDWFYMSNMTPEEVVIFNIFDNQGRPHLAHSALDLHEQAEVTTPRMSIETRTLVRYE